MTYYSNDKRTANGSWKSDDEWDRSSHWKGKEGWFISWVSLLLKYAVSTNLFIVCYCIFLVQGSEGTKVKIEMTSLHMFLYN